MATNPDAKEILSPAVAVLCNLRKMRLEQDFDAAKTGQPHGCAVCRSPWARPETATPKIPAICSDYGTKNESCSVWMCRPCLEHAVHDSGLCPFYREPTDHKDAHHRTIRRWDMWWNIDDCMEAINRDLERMERMVDNGLLDNDVLPEEEAVIQAWNDFLQKIEPHADVLRERMVTDDFKRRYQDGTVKETWNEENAKDVKGLQAALDEVFAVARLEEDFDTASSFKICGCFPCLRASLLCENAEKRLLVVFDSFQDQRRFSRGHLDASCVRRAVLSPIRRYKRLLKS